ncbi:hypothetical protein [Thalassoroseus pseudoceratinae]|uniref:hypothetical protein n=1 Tax=Thalassoroseus pseudoceratinae TaxID=2713176 RepID=UPI001421AF0D|nr:hypothetical protein [Thalassoroseus pseudoceratinae]
MNHDDIEIDMNEINAYIATLKFVDETAEAYWIGDTSWDDRSIDWCEPHQGYILFCLGDMISMSLSGVQALRLVYDIALMCSEIQSDLFEFRSCFIEDEFPGIRDVAPDTYFTWDCGLQLNVGHTSVHVTEKCAVSIYNALEPLVKDAPMVKHNLGLKAIRMKYPWVTRSNN